MYKVIPIASVSFTAGIEAKTAGGTALMARTGMRHSVTQVAWPIQATANLEGDFLISSKRESLPSFKTRSKRKEPTAFVRVSLEKLGALAGLGAVS